MILIFVSVFRNDQTFGCFLDERVSWFLWSPSTTRVPNLLEQVLNPHPRVSKDLLGWVVPCKRKRKKKRWTRFLTIDMSSSVTSDIFRSYLTVSNAVAVSWLRLRVSLRADDISIVTSPNRCPSMASHTRLNFPPRGFTARLSDSGVMHKALTFS